MPGTYPPPMTEFRPPAGGEGASHRIEFGQTSVTEVPVLAQRCAPSQAIPPMGPGPRRSDPQVGCGVAVPTAAAKAGVPSTRLSGRKRQRTSRRTVSTLVNEQPLRLRRARLRQVVERICARNSAEARRSAWTQSSSDHGSRTGTASASRSDASACAFPANTSSAWVRTLMRSIESAG